MIEQFINFVIRPPRAEYDPEQFLWEPEFTLAGRKYKRQDIEITNGRGHILRCSHYVPATYPEDSPLPCVIYCHGNSGCRADANEAAVILLPSNITVFTLDFSGSGLSDGDYVSLGWHEKDDLKAVVSFLRNNKQVSRIGLWGRSMGAVTSLLYGAEDPSIAGMVLDSAFSNLFNLMMELVDVYKIRLPKFTIKLAVQYMRHIIQRRVKFDIMDLNAVQFAPKTFIPALFGHAADDIFIQSHHSDLIYNSYAGDKNIIKFEGDHNSPRPQFYYDSVSIFFYNVLRPPPISSLCSSRVEKYYDLGSLKVGSGVDENLLYEIIAGIRSASSDAASTSSAPFLPKGPHTKSVVELLSESGVITQTDLGANFLEEAKFIIEAGGNNNSNPHFPQNEEHQEKVSGQNEECCSYTSSNRESWGRCSSLGGISEEESSSAECARSNSRHQTALKVLATPLRRIQRKSNDVAKEKNKKKKKPKDYSKKDEKSDKYESLSQRLRHCFLGRSTANHRRQRSS